MPRLIASLDACGRFAAPAGAIALVFLTEAEMGRLHARFLDDPSPTDVITFAGDEPGLAGEICVCPDVARAYPRDHGHAFHRELALYVAHGYLHLAGFDDTTAVARRRMRRAERVALAVLARAGALPRFTWR